LWSGHIKKVLQSRKILNMLLVKLSVMNYSS
jgi:hypothetical protein